MWLKYFKAFSKSKLLNCLFAILQRHRRRKYELRVIVRTIRLVTWPTYAQLCTDLFSNIILWMTRRDGCYGGLSPNALGGYEVNILVPSNCWSKARNTENLRLHSEWQSCLSLLDVAIYFYCRISNTIIIVSGSGWWVLVRE